MRKTFFGVLLILMAFLVLPGAASKQDRVVLSADNTLVMDHEFNPQSVAKLTLQANALDQKLSAGAPLYLVMLSPGGSIEAGLELIDNLNALNRPINTITLFSASMAFQTVQGLNGKRYLTPSGTLMSHKARGQFQGEFPGQLDSRYQYYLKRIGKLDERTVARSNGKLTLASYRALYENEYWCQGEDCVATGVADEVKLVTCDSTLSGTKTAQENMNVLGMAVQVKVKEAACPTITGVLSSEAMVNGKPADFSNLDNLVSDFNLTPRQALELKTKVEAKINELSPAKTALQ